MKLLCVLNPIAGSKSKDEFLEYFNAAKTKYGLNAEIHRTTGSHDIRKLREKIAAYAPDKIAAIGGDGTFTLTALAAMDSMTPIGIVPLGSANGMAKELGVNQDPEEAFNDILKSDIVEKMDMICVNGEHYCLHIGDIGLNARIVKKYDDDGERGMITYAKYLASELGDSKQFHYTIKANGAEIEGEGVMVAFGNGRKFGTGVPINKVGNPFDGKFEIVTIKSVDVGTIVKAGLSIMDDIYIDDANNTVISTDKAEIKLMEPQLVQADGEVLGTFDKIEIQVQKAVINLITTNENPYLQNSEN